MSEQDTELLNWKISREAFGWAESERARLRHEGQSLSQADLFDRMRWAYEIPARHQAMVNEFVRLLDDDSKKFSAFRETVADVLADRLKSRNSAAR